MPTPDEPGALVPERLPLGSIEDERATLAALSTEELRAELSSSLRMTARHLRRLAAIVRTLEERGEDLSDLRIGLMSYLRKIAYGQVLPEVVVRFAESPMLVRTIGALPTPDQGRLASGEGVTLVVRREDGRFDRRHVDPLALTRDQVAQVFVAGRLRDEAEQILYLEGRPARGIVPRGRQPLEGPIRADPKKGILIVGRTRLNPGQVVEALGRLRRPEEPEDASDTQALVLQLTARQHRALKVAAARADVPMSTLARRALASLGLLEGEED